MKEYKKFTLVFVISQIISINNFIEMYYCYNEKIALWNSTSIFILCIYYIYVAFGIIMRKNWFKYFSIKDSIYFYGEFAIKLISIVLSILYIRILKNNTYGQVIYLIQVLLVILDLIIGLRVISFLKKLSNSNLNELKTYEFEINEKICNQKQYDEAILCFGCVFLMGIVNFDYSFIIVIPNLNYITLILSVTNFYLIYMAKRYFDKRIFYFKNLKLKFYKRSFIYSNLTNIVCFTTCILFSNIEIRFYVIVIWLVSNFIYSIKKVILPVSKVVNSMRKYLDK